MGWDRQINMDGDTVADALVSTVGEIRDLLEGMAERQSPVEPFPQRPIPHVVHRSAGDLCYHEIDVGPEIGH